MVQQVFDPGTMFFASKDLPSAITKCLLVNRLLARYWHNILIVAQWDISDMLLFHWRKDQTYRT